jgi:hypothetical protein
VRPRAPRPSLFPAIIGDTMAPAMHPCTGETMDSKSRFREVTRANGCVEYGNDVPLPAPPAYDHAELQNDIATAAEQVEQGYRPVSSEVAGPEMRIFGE